MFVKKIKNHNMVLFLKKYGCFLLFGLAVLVFILFELPFLNRPYYWDEAWSYASALEAMYKVGPSLLPGAIHEYLYRGHPLFFYFITTLWMNVFGDSLIAVHSFFLLISILLLISVFAIGTRLFNQYVALFASLMLISTSVFLAQATFLLPEVMLALLSLLIIYFYLQKKLYLEILFGTILVLTKETGIVLIGSILLFDFIYRLKDQFAWNTLPKKIMETSVHALPFVFGAVFFVLQKIKLGWFFYPEHVGMMTFSISEVIDKFINIALYVFRSDGRIILFCLSIVSAIYLLYKRKLSKSEASFILLSTIFMVAYMLFSAMNFYTTRYILSIIPIFYLTSSFLIYKLFENRVYITGVIVVVFLFISISFTLKSNYTGDISLGFIDMVNVHKNAVSYCEEEGYHDYSISTHFLMIYNLKSPFMGYLEGNKKFNQVGSLSSTFSGDIIVVSSIERPGNLDALKNNPDYLLQKRFEKNEAWCEIYRRVQSE